MGVVFFIINAVFALVYLILVLISSLYAIFSKNPDTRYQPMRDDRASFTKSSSQLNTELDALGATARGDTNSPFKRRDLDDDSSSLSSNSYGRHPHDGSGMPYSPSKPMAQRPMSRRQPLSPVDPTLPLFPSGASNRHEPPSHHGGYDGAPHPGSDMPLLRSDGYAPTPERRSPDRHLYDRTASPQSNLDAYRQQSNRSPWQRGAGYDHP